MSFFYFSEQLLSNSSVDIVSNHLTLKERALRLTFFFIILFSFDNLFIIILNLKKVHY